MRAIKDYKYLRITHYEIGDVIYQKNSKIYLYFTGGKIQGDYKIVVLNLTRDTVHGEYASLQDAYKDIHIKDEYLVNAELVDKGQRPE